MFSAGGQLVFPGRQTEPLYNKNFPLGGQNRQIKLMKPLFTFEYYLTAMLLMLQWASIQLTAYYTAYKGLCSCYMQVLLFINLNLIKVNELPTSKLVKSMFLAMAQLDFIVTL